MNKVDELVKWAANRLWWLDNADDFDTEEAAVQSRFYTEVMKDIYSRKVKQILSHPDLALIDRGKNLPAIYGYLHYHHGEWCLTPERLSEFIDAKEWYRQSITPLAEALKGE